MAKNSKPEQPIVILHQDKSGGTTLVFHGDVKVFWVDESMPSDRVYEMTLKAPMEEIQEILGNDKVGHYGDGSSADIRAKKYEKELNGKSHLTVVKDDE